MTMKVFVQFGQDETSKKKRKLEGFEEITQMAYKTKTGKSRDGRKKESKSKRFNKMSAAERQHEFPENNDERKRKRFKVDKLDLLKSVNDYSDNEDEVAAKVVETPSQAVENTYHKRIENLTQEQDERIKKIYKERHKIVRSGPFLELKEPGEEASLKTNEDVRYPLVFPDIEEVLTHLQYNCHLTRWLHLKRATKVNNTVVLSVEGPSLEEYIYQQEDCPTLQSCRVGVEFVSPLSYGDCVEHAFATKLDVNPPVAANIKEGFQNMKSCPNKDGFIVGLDSIFNIKWNSENEVPTDVSLIEDSNTNHQPRKRKASIAALDLADDESIKDKDCNKSIQVLFDETEKNYNYCLKTKQALPISLYKRDNFSRLDLVMSPRDMANQKYPLPFIPRYKSFVRTKDEYKELTEKSPMLGLDCEMCETTAGLELTRISVVNEKHEVVYEKLVKPDNKITNYLTKFSGITPKMLNPITTKLADVQRELKDLLPSNAILVGQSLNCDLVAMKMMHPYVIDTSMIFNLSGVRECKTKLKTLCAEFLSERIQSSSRKGHDSIEDALAALKLVQKKLSHSLDWGDAVLGFYRTEEESRIANLEMLEKDKQNVKTRLRLALNAIVDDASQFDAPTHHLLSKHKQRSSSLESKSKKMEDILSELHGDETILKEPASSTKQKEKSSGTVKKPQIRPSNYIYSEVAVIGSKEVHKLYKNSLPESAKDRVKFIKACDSKEVIKNLLDLDSKGDQKRLILAHLKSPCVCQVEKWANKLISQVSENDLVCILLCGKTQLSAVRGAFFATLPTVDRMPTVKEFIQDYLKSINYQSLSYQEPDES